MPSFLLRSHSTWSSAVVRLALLVVLGGSAVAKLASPYSSEFVIPVWTYYGVAMFELVLMVMLCTRWSRAAGAGVMALAFGGIVFAIVTFPGLVDGRVTRPW